MSLTGHITAPVFRNDAHPPLGADQGPPHTAKVEVWAKGGGYVSPELTVILI